jgi:hypothetical protein
VKWGSVKWVVGEIFVGEMYPNRFILDKIAFKRFMELVQANYCLCSLYTEKNNLFEGVLYHRRNITISITILVGREREKKNNKTDILRVRIQRKNKLLLKKKIWIC